MPSSVKKEKKRKMSPANNSVQDQVKVLSTRVDHLEQTIRGVLTEFEKFVQNSNVTRMQIFSRHLAYERAGLLDSLKLSKEKWDEIQEECWQKIVGDYEAFLVKQMELQQAQEEENKLDTQPAEASKEEDQGEGEEEEEDDNVILFSKK